MKTLLSAGALALFATTAPAATITVLTNTSANAIDAQADSQRVGDGGPSEELSSYTATASAASGGATAGATVLADGDTGVIRATATTAGTTSDGAANATADTFARISETFSFTGSGTLTATLKLDGLWNIARPPAGGQPATPFWQVQASVAMMGLRDFVCLGTLCSPSINSDNTGAISDYIISVSRDVNSNQISAASVEFDLLTQITAGNGTLDFGNTAELLIETSGSLIATPSDSGFLSNPAFAVAAVPLPASLLLLLSGVLGLGIWGRRSAQRAA